MIDKKIDFWMRKEIEISTVEAVDARTHESIEGFAASDCVPMTRDDVRHVTRWRTDQTSIPSLHGAPIALNFLLHGKARLFSFEVRPDRSL